MIYPPQAIRLMEHRVGLTIAFAYCKARSMKFCGFEFIINKLLVQLDQSKFRVQKAHQVFCWLREKIRLLNCNYSLAFDIIT